MRVLLDGGALFRWVRESTDGVRVLLAALRAPSVDEPTASSYQVPASSLAPYDGDDELGSFPRGSVDLDAELPCDDGGSPDIDVDAESDNDVEGKPVIDGVDLSAAADNGRALVRVEVDESDAPTVSDFRVDTDGSRGGEVREPVHRLEPNPPDAT